MSFKASTASRPYKKERFTGKTTESPKSSNRESEIDKSLTVYKLFFQIQKLRVVQSLLLSQPQFVCENTGPPNDRTFRTGALPEGLPTLVVVLLLVEEVGAEVGM